MTTTYEVTAPAAFIVQHVRSGQYATDAVMDWDKGQWQVSFDTDPAAALAWPTREGALDWARSWGAGRECRLVHLRETVALTDAGRAAVAARRAARNADRKW